MCLSNDTLLQLPSFLFFFLSSSFDTTFSANQSPFPFSVTRARKTTPFAPRPTADTTFRFWKSRVSPRRTRTRSPLSLLLLSLSPAYMVYRAPREKPRNGDSRVNLAI
ncbi:hypothetical protein V8G54_020893 [Vigna mungo]|uniref:Uncharacterized protein n=1 Tax=Vigna mungo TaxID=3915 RepID=A0AAQ3RV51_VIGMU